MKKSPKRKESQVAPEVEQEVKEVDVVVLINQLQQQLAALDKKVDLLINQTKDKISEERPFSKPFQRFDRHDRFDRDRGGRDRDRGFRERSYTQAVCAECGKECEVPFKPSGDRPVYCKECFSKRKEGGSFQGNYDSRPRGGGFPRGRSFDKREGGESRGPGRRHKPSFHRRKERD